MSVQLAVGPGAAAVGCGHAAAEVNTLPAARTSGTWVVTARTQLIFIMATGNCDWRWYADIMLAIGAALIHLPIRAARLPARTAAAA